MLTLETVCKYLEINTKNKYDPPPLLSFSSLFYLYDPSPPPSPPNTLSFSSLFYLHRHKRKNTKAIQQFWKGMNFEIISNKTENVPSVRDVETVACSDVNMIKLHLSQLWI